MKCRFEPVFCSDSLLSSSWESKGPTPKCHVSLQELGRLCTISVPSHHPRRLKDLIIDLGRTWMRSLTTWKHTTEECLGGDFCWSVFGNHAVFGGETKRGFSNRNLLFHDGAPYVSGAKKCVPFREGIFLGFSRPLRIPSWKNTKVGRTEMSEFEAFVVDIRSCFGRCIEISRSPKKM